MIGIIYGREGEVVNRIVTGRDGLPTDKEAAIAHPVMQTSFQATEVDARAGLLKRWVKARRLVR